MAIALVAVLVAILAWDHYLMTPWTRDGRIRVQVASVAPQVSGQIKELRIVDNQFVHKGDVLYVIDRFDFEVALGTNTALLQQKAADLQVKEKQSERRRHLSDLATTPEEQQVYTGSAIQAKAAFEAAQQQVAQAEINLNRTQVRSPVNRYVTNLLLQVGDYAHEGASNVSIIDTDSFWIDGYFEETKMARVCVGDRAEAKLMGYSLPLIGHVATVTRGTSVSNAAAGTQGLPNVDPVLHLGAAGTASTSPHCNRRSAARRAARVRHDSNCYDPILLRRGWPNLVRSREGETRHRIFGCL
jgi:multidrug resistance efflux pump